MTPLASFIRMTPGEASAAVALFYPLVVAGVTVVFLLLSRQFEDSPHERDHGDGHE